MTMSFAPHPSFEYLPHVGEVRLRLRGSSIADVLEQAALALAESARPRSAAGRPGAGARDRARGARSCRAADRLAQRAALPRRARSLASLPHRSARGDETHLRATARGPVLECAPSLVKAATWHGLRFEVRDGGFEAEVLLDI